MSLMLNNKSDFILEYNETCNGILKRDDVDWTQSKVIFISPQFTDYQKHSVNFKDVPFELREIKMYENNTEKDNMLKGLSDFIARFVPAFFQTYQETSRKFKFIGLIDREPAYAYLNLPDILL